MYTISIRRKQRILNNYFTNSCVSIKKRVTPPTSVTSFQFQSRAFPKFDQRNGHHVFPGPGCFKLEASFGISKERKGVKVSHIHKEGEKMIDEDFARSVFYRLPLPVCTVCPFRFVSSAPSISYRLPLPCHHIPVRSCTSGDPFSDKIMNSLSVIHQGGDGVQICTSRYYFVFANIIKWMIDQAQVAFVLNIMQITIEILNTGWQRYLTSNEVSHDTK